MGMQPVGSTDTITAQCASLLLRQAGVRHGTRRHCARPSYACCTCRATRISTTEQLSSPADDWRPMDKAVLSQVAVMIRPLRALTIVVILAAAAARSSAQPLPGTPSSRAALEEAKQLNELVVKLYGEGKFK